MVRRFQNRRRVPDAAADAASAMARCLQNFVRAHRMFPVVGALIGAAVGLLCLGLRSIGVPDLAAAALALGASAIMTGALHEDGLADVADGFGGGRDSRIEAGDHARQPARHLWRHDPAGELCRKAVGAGSDPGRLCRAEPDRRARAGARRLAGDVAEPALCAQGRLGPQRRPARCGDGGDRRRAGAADRAVVAVVEQRVATRRCWRA